MNEHTIPTDVDEFVDALLRCAGQLMLIVDHMAQAAARPGANGAPVDQVLRGLLAETLAPRMDARSDLTAATALLEIADTVIGEELFLVPAAEECRPPHPRRARTRRRRG